MEETPYFKYLTFKQYLDISQLVLNGLDGNRLQLKMLSIIYEVEEKILEKMIMTYIIELINAIENGNKDDVKKEKEMLHNILRDKNLRDKTNRFELMDIE